MPGGGRRLAREDPKIRLCRAKCFRTLARTARYPSALLLEWSTNSANAPHGDAAQSARQPDDEAQSERELIVRVRAGDRSAFGAVVERHIARALALGLRLLHHREDAEDLVQDAFLSALEHIDAFDPARPFWPWLSRIIVNRGLDLAAARSVRITEAIPDTVSDSHGSPADFAERRDILARFRHELALLPTRQQLVVRLVELDGYDVAEIAELLGSSPSTVRWHLHMGRQRLRAALAPFRREDP
jgi:RNA polymerase sigma-70 factor (ECF subfamily)